MAGRSAAPALRGRSPRFLLPARSWGLLWAESASPRWPRGGSAPPRARVVARRHKGRRAAPQGACAAPQGACHSSPRGRSTCAGGRSTCAGTGGTFSPRRRWPCWGRTTAALMRTGSRPLGASSTPLPSKAIPDAGWRACWSSRSVKAAGAGRPGLAVPPAATSHAGSGGGVLRPNGVSVRWHLCPDCGTSRHRDHHAARDQPAVGARPPWGRADPSGANVAHGAARRLSSSRMYPGECQVIGGQGRKKLRLVVEQRREMALFRVVGRCATGEPGRHPACHPDRHVGIERTMPEVERLEGYVLQSEVPVASVQLALVDGSPHPLAIGLSGGCGQWVNEAMGQERLAVRLYHPLHRVRLGLAGVPFIASPSLYRPVIDLLRQD
jgi:hypothetical protein